MRERADRDRLDVARQHPGRVGDRLAPRELQLVSAQRQRRAAELRHRGRERDAGSRRRLDEDQAERLPGELGAALVLQLDGQVEHRLDLVRGQVRDPQQVPARHQHRRRAHDQRSFAAATAAATSPRRLPAGGASKVPGAHLGRDLLVRVAERRPSSTSALGGVGRPEQRVGAGRGHAARDRARAPPTSTASAASAPATSCRAANTGGLSSCRSRLYASGRDLTVASRPVRRPIAVPALPRVELGDVGVQLLRHHRRARRGALRQPREPELARRPEHELLADARQVREERRATHRDSRARSRGRRPRRASCAAGSAGGEAAASSRPARRRRAATAPPAPPRRRTARGRARASRPTRAGGGPASRRSRAAGACSRASACSASASARSSTVKANRCRAAAASSHASPTYSRNAAATWSLRERPAWILRPIAPSSRSMNE